MRDSLEIRHCASCPMATRDFHGDAACGARIYLDPGNPEDRVTLGDGYPSPPPDWCPLRASPVTLSVAASVPEEGTPR